MAKKNMNSKQNEVKEVFSESFVVKPLELRDSPKTPFWLQQQPVVINEGKSDSVYKELHNNCDSTRNNCLVWYSRFPETHNKVSDTNPCIF